MSGTVLTSTGIIAMAVGMRITTLRENVRWCIAELRHKSESFKQSGAVSVLDGDVVNSDTAIPPSLKDALNAAVAELEDVLDLLVTGTLDLTREFSTSCTHRSILSSTAAPRFYLIV